MKVFYDCEFWEDGPDRPIELISIGMVREDGAELYRVNADAPLTAIAQQHPWLRENVLNHLPVHVYQRPQDQSWDAEWIDEHPDAEAIWNREQVRDHVREFLVSTPDLELWAWYGAYDHVVLCQLFGKMIDLPAGVPMWTNDLKQECFRLGNPTMPAQTGGVHNALADARHNKVMAEFLAIVDGQDDGTQHVIEFRADGWTIEHPPSCGDDCPVDQAAVQDLIEPRKLPTHGRFECWANDIGDRLLIGDRVAEQA